MLDPLMQYLLRFVNISQEEFDLIRESVEIRHFNKKVTLINIGEQEHYVNFVVRGLVRKFFYRRKEEIITQIAKEGELICSSVSFLSGISSDYVVETIEPTTVVSLSRENMEKLYGRSYKMDRLGRLIIIDWLLQKEYWEYARIKKTPRDRAIKFIIDNPDMLIRVPQKYLASYLNIKPETFSRYKHAFIHATKNEQYKVVKRFIHQ